MKSRSSGYSSDTEQQAKQQDLSLLRKPILTSLNGFLEAKRAFDNGTEEIRRLLSRECDIMYECKVCRNVFRSLTNFISHKRVYCREQYNHLNYFDSHKNGFIDQDVSTIIQAEQDYIKNSSCNTINSSLRDGSTTTTNITASTNNTSSNKTSNNNNNSLSSSEKTSKDLSSIIERLIKREQVNRVLKLTDFYDQITNKLTQEEILRKNHILQLDRVPNSKNAVYQTIKHNDNDNIKNEVIEIHELLLNNKTVLGPDGKILINKNYDVDICNNNGIIGDTNNIDNKDIKSNNNNDDVGSSSTEICKPKMKIELTTISGQNSSSSDKMDTIGVYHQPQSNVVCEICNQKFQTEKTLKLHLQTKHIQSTYVYQCPSCTQTFLQPGAVIRHLSNDHKKSMRRIRLMRETIYKRRIRLDEIQVKGPNRELARLQTYNKQRDSSENNKIWFDNNERTQTNSPNCTYCGKKFERKAVLTTHLNNCSAKNRQTPPTISSASSSKKTELTQNNSLSTSSITSPLATIATTTATATSSLSSSSSSTTTTSTATTSVLQNTTSNPSAFIRIEPKIEQSKLNTNNNSTIVDSFEITGNNTVDKSKSFKHNADLVDKKLSNTLKLLREEQQKQQQQNQSINPLIVNKRKRRRTKKTINPIIVKSEINNKPIIDEIDNLNDTKLSNGLSLQNHDNKLNDKKSNITGHSSTDISTEKLEKSSSSTTSPKQTINNKKDNSNSRSVVSGATIKKDKNKLLKLIAKNSEKELRYFCRICKKSFSALSNLRRHISMFHYRRRKFGCKICDYRAFRKYDVSNHLNSVHSIFGDKTFDMILVAEDKTIKEDVDDDVIVVEKGNNINLNDIQNLNNSTSVTPNSINTNQILADAPGTAENNTKKTYVQKRGRKPKLPKNSNNNNDTAVLVIDDKDNLNFSKFTRSSSNLSLSSNEDINVVAPKRPIRNRIKPVNKDFVYDLSNLLKKDMLHAERESLITAKAAAQRRRNTVITIDDSSRESVASTSTSISNSPHNSEIDTGKGIIIKDQIKGSAQTMAQLAVSSFSACFNTPPELPTERPLIPSKLLAQIRHNDQIINNNIILNKTIPDIENYQGGFKGFDDMKKIKQLRRVSDDSIIRSLTKKRKIDLDYASLSDSPSSRLLRKVDMNINGRQEDFLGFQPFKNNPTTTTATVISQQNGNSQNNTIEENINNNDIETKITEKILVKCPTEKEFQEYLIANKLTDPVKKINITEAMEAEAVTSADDDLLNNTDLIDNQTNGSNKRITLLQRMADNKHKKLKESLLRSALEN